MASCRLVLVFPVVASEKYCASCQAATTTTTIRQLRLLCVRAEHNSYCLKERYWDVALAPRSTGIDQQCRAAGAKASNVTAVPVGYLQRPAALSPPPLESELPHRVPGSGHPANRATP